MTALVPLIFMVVLLFALIWCLLEDMPAVVNLALVGIILWLGHTAYQNFDDLVALWDDIQNFPDAAAAWAVATWNEITHGFTAWGWAGFSLAVLFALLVGSALSWPSVRALFAVKVAQLERERDEAKEEAKREREKAKQAEQTAAQDREDAKRAVSLMRSAERRAEGLEGQIKEAVRLADSRGLQLREIREKKRAENAGLPTQPDTQQAAQAANGRHKKPHGTRGNKRNGKETERGRLPKK